MKVTRRTLLYASGLSAGGLAVGATRVPFLFDWFGTSLDTRLAAVYRHSASAAFIGEAYLRGYPSENDKALLLRKIAGNSAETEAWLTSASPSQLAEWLDATIRRDFAEGRTAEVERWMLSRTEARICALTAFRHA